MDRLLFRQEEKIGYLTLNRADKYNAVNSRMLDECTGSDETGIRQQNSTQGRLGFI